MSVVRCKEVSKSFGNMKALQDVTFTIEKDIITGVIGRNGAGKTTLLKLIAGFTHSTSGEIQVFSQNPFNSLLVSANTILVDDQMGIPTTLDLREVLQVAKSFYPNWDHELALRLFDYFSFKAGQRHNRLSKGMKSTFNMIIGLAARCPLTIFDEPTTGMDAAVRADFYRALLKDYLAHPRTILLSSHHMDEVEDILEDVLLIKEGTVCLHKPLSKLKSMAIGISGQKHICDQWIKGRKIYYSTTVGIDSTYVVVEDDFYESEKNEIKAAGLELSAVQSSDLCVYLTSKTKGGIDDVFKEN